MKKNNKGFTLIEVLTVIILLSIIGVVTLPNLTNIQQSTQNRIDRSTKLLIINAAKIYVSNYRDEVDQKLASNGNTYSIPIGKLKAYDFLNINNDEVDISNFNKTCVKITKTTVSGKTKYTYNYDSTDTSCSSGDYTPPILYVEDKISGSNCSTQMQASSLNDFYNKCRVNARDDRSSKTGLTPIDVEESATASGSIATLTYEYSDAAGNAAKPLKVILTIQ